MSIKAIKLTQSLLKELLSYDHETGVFIWRVHKNGRATIGSMAGTVLRGYIIINIYGRRYRAHRLAFLYMKGKLPITKYQVDHINGIKDDNKWKNLRLCRGKQNMRNRASRKNSASEFKGVHRNGGGGKWCAEITHNYKKIYLGIFNCEKEAARAYNTAAKKHFGEFAFLNKID